MKIPRVNSRQLFADPVPLSHGPNYQLTLLDGKVNSCAFSDLRLNRKRLRNPEGQTVAPLLNSSDHWAPRRLHDVDTTGACRCQAPTGFFSALHSRSPLGGGSDDGPP